MLPRFFAPAVGGEGSAGDVALSEDESRHARTVLRLGVGDAVAVFDGRGHEWQARITTLTRSAVNVQLESALVPAAEPRVSVTLLQAVLKGDHMDAVVRDATMLGVVAIRPMITAHTVVSERAVTGGGARERWLRVAVASAKQCRRAVVPHILEAETLEDGLNSEAVASANVRFVLAEPIARGEQRTFPLASVLAAVLAVGPEGGWSREELERFADAGFSSLTLGTLTLRADAAAVVAMSVLRDRWRDL